MTQTDELDGCDGVNRGGSSVLVRPSPLVIPPLALSAPPMLPPPHPAAAASIISGTSPTRSFRGTNNLPPVSPRVSGASTASLMTGPNSPRGTMPGRMSMLMSGASTRGGASAGQAVCAVLHVRPMSDAERAEGCERVVRASAGAAGGPGCEASVDSGRDRTDSFAFDGVFGEEAGGAPPSRLYADCVAPLVEGVFSGVNAAVMAYGQTGAGKSFTM